jgi:hypothetical protein
MSDAPDSRQAAMSRGSAHAAETSQFLVRERAATIVAAEAALARTHARHYETAGANSARERLEALYDRLIEAVDTRELGGVVAYARQVARERYDAGYDLSEVQAAFNTLEEANMESRVGRVEPGTARGSPRAGHNDPGSRQGRSRPRIRIARHEPTRPLARLESPLPGNWRLTASGTTGRSHLRRSRSWGSVVVRSRDSSHHGCHGALPAP